MSDTNPAVDQPETRPEAAGEPQHPSGQHASGEERVGDAPALLPRDAGQMLT